MRYLCQQTNNQYFITTHSAALMDTPEAEIYHIKMEQGQSIAEYVSSDTQRSNVCGDLGYHPSDLLQANCVIWVEGPSDRIYLNFWIKHRASEFIEGIHYAIMFYGGRLLSHLTGGDTTEWIDDFISLRRLNQRGVIVIDSDKKSARSPINDTKKRLKNEFDDGLGFAWITKGREIENYIGAEHIKAAILSVHPHATCSSGLGPYDNTLSITSKSEKTTQANKVKVAKHIVEKTSVDLGVLDLKEKIDRLIEFISASNPCTNAIPE